MFVAGLTAVFVEFVAYRRLRMRGTNRLATLISAIGISIALAEVMRLLTNSRPVGSPRVLEKIILTEVWGANIRLDTVNYYHCSRSNYTLYWNDSLSYHVWVKQSGLFLKTRMRQN